MGLLKEINHNSEGLFPLSLQYFFNHFENNFNSGIKQWLTEFISIKYNFF